MVSLSRKVLYSAEGLHFSAFHSPRNGAAVAALSTSASHPHRQHLDVPLRQHSLLLAINEAVHQHLLSPAPSTCAHVLAHSSALPHTGDWLNGVP